MSPSEKPRITRREEDLLVLLKHARGCDGRTNAEGVCPICRRIDRQLMDGARYAIDDREAREDLIRRALKASLQLSGRLAEVIERAPVQAATRSSSMQLTEWLGRILYLFDSPLTGGVVRDVNAMSSTPPARVKRVMVVVSAEGS